MMNVLDVNNWTANLKAKVIDLLQSASPPKIPRLSNETNEISNPYNSNVISKPKNKCSYMFREVAKILDSDKIVELPPMTNSELGPPMSYVIQKIAWWILKSEKDPPMLKIIHPENADLDFDDPDSLAETELCFEDGSVDVSFSGNVSDPEGECMRKMDPHKICNVDEDEELCGKTSLELALIRNVFSGDSSSQDFVPYLIQAPDTNINRASFEVKCRVCNVNLLGARGLGNHLLQESHKQKFRNLSLDLASYFEVWEKPKKEKLYTASLKSYDLSQNVDFSIMDLEMQIPSKDNYADISLKLPSLGSKNIFENVKNEVNERLRPLKEEMEIKNDWNTALHKKWNTALDEEKRLIEQYYEDVEKFLKDAKSYPDYVKEWEEFWCAKNDELLDSGKEADQYDYEGLWKKVWPKKLRYMLKKETDEKILQMRKKLGMDYESLYEMATTPSSQNELQVALNRNTNEHGFILSNNENRESCCPPSGHSNYLSGRNRSSQTPPRHKNNGNRHYSKTHSSQSRSPKHYSNQRSSQSYNRQNSRSPSINPNKGNSHRNVNRGSSKHHRGSSNPSNSNQNISNFHRERRNRNNDWHDKRRGHPSNFNRRKRNHSSYFRPKRQR